MAYCRGRNINIHENVGPFREVYDLEILHKNGTYKTKQVILADLDKFKDDCLIPTKISFSHIIPTTYLCYFAYFSTLVRSFLSNALTTYLHPLILN